MIVLLSLSLQDHSFSLAKVLKGSEGTGVQNGNQNDSWFVVFKSCSSFFLKKCFTELLFANKFHHLYDSNYFF